MPLYYKDKIICLPNKAGANNALVRLLGPFDPPKNGICVADVMTSCEERPRLISMWRFMSAGKMSPTSKYCDTTFEQWLDLWLEQRRINKMPSSTNSWWLTIAECRVRCMPKYEIRAEHAAKDITAVFGITDLKPAGVWIDACRHRLGWEPYFTEEVEWKLKNEHVLNA